VGAREHHWHDDRRKLGIADAVKAKAVIAQGRPVGAAIASGEAEIGMQQVAELRPVPGIDVIGELPADLEKQIPYSADIAAKAKDPANAPPPPPCHGGAFRRRTRPAGPPTQQV
jgi:hypothetical protein